MYSLFTGKKINQKFAITGEIDLQGSVSAIGGLEEKIFGAIQAGVKTIIIPKDKRFEKNFLY